ncbi:hypothetical protein XA68_16836 [Ophiocordyceps unilateralis]|uniref:Uncharacterized protein n=1 Tax=Ophiocordyceps unilateralis TaxID=268505 RepID=A0A2A9P5U4_OPHUN|nr:hypothetical protein XA68_16836 [Ophiocordyceps unilateralis]
MHPGASARSRNADVAGCRYKLDFLTTLPERLITVPLNIACYCVPADARRPGHRGVAVQDPPPLSLPKKGERLGEE